MKDRPSTKLPARPPAIMSLSCLRRRSHPRKYTRAAKMRETEIQNDSNVSWGMCDIIGGLWFSSRRFQLPAAEHQLPCRIACRALGRGVQGFKERYQRRRLCRTQVVPIGGHVSAALDDLPDELVPGKPHGNAIQGWPPLSAHIAKGVAIAALLDLKHQRSLTLERGCSMNVPFGHWIAAPGTHMRTPGRKLGEPSKRAQGDRDHQHGYNRNRPTLPALFSFSGKKRQKDQANNDQGRTDQKKRGFQ